MADESIQQGKTEVEMVEEFQCPGCVNGSDTKCGKFESPWAQGCSNHAAGTAVALAGKIVPFFLGMPKGFNRTEGETVRVCPSSQRDYFPLYDKLNVPVWARERGGFLFVRCYCPRIDVRYIDVIEGGKISELPLSPIDVGKLH